MSDFLKSSLGGSSSPPPDMNARKEALKQGIRQELAVQNAQELMNKANDRCFLKCVTKPGSSLSGSEQTCLSRCLDRYMDAFTIVSRTYVTRIGKERGAQANLLVD